MVTSKKIEDNEENDDVDDDDDCGDGEEVDRFVLFISSQSTENIHPNPMSNNR